MLRRLPSGLVVAALLITTVPAAVLADGHVEVLEGVSTVVVVQDPATTPDFPAGSLSRAECSVLVRITADGGSSQELMTCQLSDEPLMVPENQGPPPEQPLIDAGGECIWQSDYHFTQDGSEVGASAYEAVVLPSGRVFTWSSYPAEPLDCAVEE